MRMLDDIGLDFLLLFPPFHLKNYSHFPSYILPNPIFHNKNLQHAFFSDSGSTAVEVGVKMALSYWRNLGETRSRIVVLEHAYHGDTIGTMSLGMRGIFNASYVPLLFEVLRLPFPNLENEDEITPLLIEIYSSDDERPKELILNRNPDPPDQ